MLHKEVTHVKHNQSSVTPDLTHGVILLCNGGSGAGGAARRELCLGDEDEGAEAQGLVIRYGEAT